MFISQCIVINGVTFGYDKCIYMNIDCFICYILHKYCFVSSDRNFFNVLCMLLLWVGWVFLGFFCCCCCCCCFFFCFFFGGGRNGGGNRVVLGFFWGEGITEMDPTTHRTLTRHYFTELQKHEGRLCHAHTARALDSLLHTSTLFAAGQLLPRFKKKISV